MKKSKISAMIAASAFCGLMMNACAPKTVNFDAGGLPDTPNCQFAKESCKEAEAFQGQYERMNREEKEEAKAVLNAYIQQCEDAQELCKKSADAEK